jgi:hypothetical protein
MRMPRFRLRTLMIAVAVVAVGLVGVNSLPVTRTRQQARQNTAYWHNVFAISQSQFARMQFHQREALRRGEFPVDLPEAEWPAKLDRALRSAEWHEALARKYECAAHYPWLPVPADPPEPK